ncbi:MAG: hypothetical protein ACPGVE_08625, partial [Flavobacteriales bacterium]
MKSNKQLLFQTLNFQYLAIVICLIFQSNFTKAQSLQSSLEQATRDLVNPIYAIIEVPQTDGTIKYIEVKKNELDKISQLEDNYNWVKNVELAIDESIFYYKTLEISSDYYDEKEYLRVTLSENCVPDTFLVMKDAPSTKIQVIPAKYKTVTKQVLAKTYSPKLITIPAKYKT